MTFIEILKASGLKDSLNESQMTEIEDIFNEAVDLKAAEIADGIIAEKVLELKESYDEKQVQLAEEFRIHTDNFENQMIEKLDSFIEENLQKFIDESKYLLESELNEEKTNALLSIFDNLIETAGIDAAELVENGRSKADLSYNRLCEKYDALVSEKTQLKKEVIALRNKQIIQEATEGMTLLEADKFRKIAELIVLNEEEEECAKEKVKNLKKSVSKDDPEDTDDTEADDTNKDSKKDLKESKIDWSRF